MLSQGRKRIFHFIAVMGVAGLILGSLIGLAVASVAASTIGELVINAMWLDLNFPFLGKTGGDCALISNTAFTVCVFSGVTFLVFVVAAVLYIAAGADVAKFLALGGVSLHIGVFVCAVILYAKVPPRGEHGERDAAALDCDFSKLTAAEVFDWRKQWAEKLKSYGDGASQVYTERTYPADGWLTYMVWSAIGLVLLIVVVVMVILKFPGIYDIFPAHSPVVAE
jgi:hypothetical protein